MTAHDAVVKPYTWAALGYRRLNLAQLLADEPSRQRLMEMVVQNGHYHFLAPDWIRHAGRKRSARISSLAIEDDFSATDVVDDAALGFVDSYFDWYERLPVDPVHAGPPRQDLISLVERADEEGQPWRFIKHIASAAVFANNRRDLKELLRSYVLPAFFGKYPSGRIVVIGNRFAYTGLTATLRALYTATQVPTSDWEASGIHGFPTLRHWHDGEIESFGLHLFQGQRQLTPHSRKHFEHEVVVPAARATFHDNTVFARMLL